MHPRLGDQETTDEVEGLCAVNRDGGWSPRGQIPRGGGGRDGVRAPVGRLPCQAGGGNDRGADRGDGDRALRQRGDRGYPPGSDRRAGKRRHHSPGWLDRHERPRRPAVPGGRRQRVRGRAARECGGVRVRSRAGRPARPCACATHPGARRDFREPPRPQRRAVARGASLQWQSLPRRGQVLQPARLCDRRHDHRCLRQRKKGAWPRRRHFEDRGQGAARGPLGQAQHGSTPGPGAVRDRLSRCRRLARAAEPLHAVRALDHDRPRLGLQAGHRWPARHPDRRRHHPGQQRRPGLRRSRPGDRRGDVYLAPGRTGRPGLQFPHPDRDHPGSREEGGRHAEGRQQVHAALEPRSGSLYPRPPLPRLQQHERCEPDSPGLP